MTLEKKIVFITGASGKIGVKTAKLLLQEGYKVITGFLKNKEPLEKLSHLGEILPIKIDLEDEESIKNAVNTIKNKYGKIYALINNAGMNIPNDFNKISIEEWGKVLNVNLRGMFLLTKELDKIINDGGSIVNIASFSGQVGGPRTSHYTAAKAGVIGLSENMARFYAPRGIRVNCVSPGLIESEMANAAKRLPILDNILLGRMGKPEEIASVICFLISDKASYINAQTINVNGGLSYSF
jgi:3-oxoacyl-[acyl-carrier protein] reductase